jgi:hypothetical protein
VGTTATTSRAIGASRHREGDSEAKRH